MPLVTVTGNIKALLNLPTRATFTSGSVRFMLVLPARVNLTPVVAATGATFPTLLTVDVSGDGSFSAQVQGNDGISPADTTWLVTYNVPNVSAPSQIFSITGTNFNLNVAVPSPAPVDQVVGVFGSQAFPQGPPANTVLAGPITLSTDPAANLPTFRPLVTADLPVVAINFGPQGAGLIFAGPPSGLSAVPAFRVLVSTDIPTALAGNYSFTGVNTHGGAETFTGAVTHGGAETFTGAVTHGGAETFTGAVTHGAATNFNAGVSVNAGLVIKGPNPYVDVTAYGVRAMLPSVTPAIPGITATMSAGSAVATLSSASTFQNGDGVTVYGAGTASGLATPAAPTVTPSAAQILTGTGQIVTGSNGTTIYNYQIVARTTGGGLTAASPVGSTTVGRAVLGSRSAVITSATRAGTTMTFTTAAHELIVGEMVYVKGASVGSFDGWYQTVTVADNTHFTVSSGADTAAGAETSATGGTVFWYNLNRLTWAAVTGAWEYYVYGRTGGALTLLGVSKPQSATQVDLTWDDFGSPMMDGILLPFNVPSTPPTAATANSLTTTIASGAGTTSLVLGTAATTAVTGATILFDNASNILTAANAALANLGMLYFPVNPQPYVINSYLKLPGFLSVSQAGILFLNDTVEFGSDTKWSGSLTPISNSTGPSFSWLGTTRISVGQANPGFYIPGPSFRHAFAGLTFQSSANGSVQVVADQLNNDTFDSINFIGVGGATDLMSVGLLLRGAATNSSFSNKIRKCTFVFGGNGNGSTATPSLQLNGAGQTTVEDLQLGTRGAWLQAVSSGAGGVDFRLVGGRMQAGVMPPLTVAASGGVGGYVEVTGYELDTMAHALIAHFSTTVNGPTSFGVVINGGNPNAALDGAVTPGMVTGLKFPGVLYNFTGGGSFGQNTAIEIIDRGLVSVPGMFVSTFGTGTIGYRLAVPAAPTAVLSVGAGVPVGQVQYTITAVDANGNETFPLSAGSAILNATATNGTVTVTPPTLPAGATGWKPYRAVGGSSTYALANYVGCGAAPTGASFAPGVAYVDNFGFTCGTSPPALNSASSVSLSSSGLRAGPSLLTPAGLLGLNLNAPVAQLDQVIFNATTVGQSIQAAAAPTANIFQVKDSTGAVRYFIGADFAVHGVLDTGLAATTLKIGGAIVPTAKGTANQVLAMDATATNLIFANTGTGTGNVSTSPSAAQVITPTADVTGLAVKCFGGGVEDCVQFYGQASMASPSTATTGTVVGGALPASTYFAKVTCVDPAGGETLPSAESLQASIVANSLLTVIAPTATQCSSSAVGWLPYVTLANGATNTEKLQAVTGNCTTTTRNGVTSCSIGQNWTEPTAGTTGTGAAPPTAGTARIRNFWIDASGNFNFSGNVLDLGSATSTTQGTLRVHGGNTNALPGVLGLFNNADAVTSYLSGAATAGRMMMSNVIPGAEDATKFVLTASSVDVNITGKQFATVATATNCAVNSISPAACGSAAAGSFVVPAATTSYTVNTTAVKAASRVFLFPHTDARDLPGAPTCVVPVATTEPTVSSIVAAASFTLALASTAGQTCWDYLIVN